MPGPIIDIEPEGYRQPTGVFPKGLTWLVGAGFFLLIGTGSIANWVLDYAWWTELGQAAAFWQQIYVHTAPILYATVFGFVVLWLTHNRAVHASGVRTNRYPWYGRAVGLVLLALSWVLGAAQFASWDVARFIGSRGLATNAWRDPIFGQPLEFYFFDLPFYRSLTGYLFVLLGFCAVVYWLTSRLWALRSRFTGAAIEIDWSDLTAGSLGGVRALATLSLVAFAAHEWLGRYSFLYEQHPFMAGADFVAVHLGIPLTTAWVIGVLLAAVAVAMGRTRLALLALLLLPVQSLVPRLVNSFYVRPNEISLQKPYIGYHLEATRQAFGLGAKFREIHPKASVQGKFDAVKNQVLLDNVRLWDWQAFHDTVSQIQPLRPYTFVDTDVDRYRINGKLQQVMVSPRELEIAQLGDAQNRWQNSHLIYTHGYGIVAADANRITPDGLPRLFIQDAPPKVSAAGLQLTRPEIYFGEVEHEPVFVSTAQPEFNYPSGSENVHNRYDGTGGIPVGSLGMRLAAAVSYGDWNIILTSALQPDSKMMVHRRVQDRLENLAPFLLWDKDPYLVLTKEGRLVWMNDGYSTSRLHPYAERVRTAETGSINYVRNAVKATVDAYTGETHIYVFAPEDPLILTYQALFPALFLDKSLMPQELRDHARYPEWIFRVQSELLLTYHMTNAEAFYNKVDVWDVARRTNGSADKGKAVIDPNFMIANLPAEAGGKGEPEFLLMLPFTPRSKDNLIGMLMARCDGDSLGELILMELPKEELFFGPMQIESRINQDQNISKDLTLWNQQGSQVLHGQMIVLPIEDTFVFVQPIYLQASQARMPQLKKVALAYGNELIYTDTYDQALAQLRGVPAAAASVPVSAGTGPSEAVKPVDTGGSVPLQRLETMRQLMERYRRSTQQGQWAEAGKALEALDAELKKKP